MEEWDKSKEARLVVKKRVCVFESREGPCLRRHRGLGYTLLHFHTSGSTAGWFSSYPTAACQMWCAFVNTARLVPPSILAREVGRTHPSHSSPRLPGCKAKSRAPAPVSATCPQAAAGGRPRRKGSHICHLLVLSFWPFLETQLKLACSLWGGSGFPGDKMRQSTLLSARLLAMQSIPDQRPEQGAGAGKTSVTHICFQTRPTSPPLPCQMGKVPPRMRRTPKLG